MIDRNALRSAVGWKRLGRSHRWHWRLLPAKVPIPFGWPPRRQRRQSLAGFAVHCSWAIHFRQANRYDPSYDHLAKHLCLLSLTSAVMSSKERRLLWIHFDWEVVFPAELFFALSWSSLFLFARGVNRQLVTAYLSLILSCKFICHEAHHLEEKILHQAALVSRTFREAKTAKQREVKMFATHQFSIE